MDTYSFWVKYMTTPPSWTIYLTMFLLWAGLATPVHAKPPPKKKHKKKRLVAKSSGKQSLPQTLPHPSFGRTPKLVIIGMIGGGALTFTGAAILTWNQIEKNSLGSKLKDLDSIPGKTIEEKRQHIDEQKYLGNVLSAVGLSALSAGVIVGSISLWAYFSKHKMPPPPPKDQRSLAFTQQSFGL